jgi:hypothetical protein
MGGQDDPISTLGDITIWKYAQKKDMKNNASEAINNNIPNRRPNCTSAVCMPM